MNVTLCSAFRNAESYIGTYFYQIDNLALALRERGDKLRIIAAFGDCTDSTGQLLKDQVIFRGASLSLLFSVDIFPFDHGGADYGSVVNEERFRNIARVCNAIWERIPQDADAVIWVESDLIWQPETMLALVDNLAEYPAVVPMVMLKRAGYSPEFFYDTWAFRMGTTHISPMPPYFRNWDGVTPLQVSSAGSCMVIRGELARKVHWPADVFVGLSRDIYGYGGSVWLDPKVSVIHE